MHSGDVYQASQQHKSNCNCCPVRDSQSMAAAGPARASKHQATPQHSLVDVQQQLLLPEPCEVDALGLQPLRLTGALWVQQVNLYSVGGRKGQVSEPS